MRCAAITRAGGRCKLEATSGSYCWSHAPENAKAREVRARRGGRAGGNGRTKEPEIEALKSAAADLYTAVLEGEILPTRGAVLVQVLNLQARLWEAERRALLASANIITREEIAEEAQTIVATVTKHVKDREACSAIMEDLSARIAALSGPGL